MRLYVLVDNNSFIDRYFLAEPGLSILVEEDSRRILFDCGFSDIFWENATKMRQDLLFLDYLVFSHSHLDHTWGVQKLIREYATAALENLDHKRPEVVAHPQALKGVCFPFVGNIGSLIGHREMALNFQTHLYREPLFLTENLIFLGEIPRKNDFENKTPIGKKDGEENPDFLPDDTALAYKSNHGLVIIAGCAHSGICNIVEHARQVCGEENVSCIIGGLHLLNPPREQLEKTADFLSDLSLDSLYAGHCTDLNSKIALSKSSPVKDFAVGLELEF